jgi:GNAT superfamily N-acetyltransferase
MNDGPADLLASAPALTLQAESAEDEAFLFEVYASTREEELAVVAWDAAARRRFLEMQFRAMRKGYRGMFPDAEFAVILLDGRPVGRAVVDRSGEAIHVVDLALLGPERNQGIGTRLLRQWTEEAAQTNRPLRLRVLKGSRARRLYERLGFMRTDDDGLYEGLEWRAPGGEAGGSRSEG